MKTYKYIIAALVLSFGLSSCVNDLNVKPIDPALNTADKALVNEADYFSLLTECYAGFSTSGSWGPNGDCHISGIDGGFSQYYRGRYHLNGLTTDEAVCGWNDQTIKDFHFLKWTTSDVFVTAFYYRVFYQISACNEFLRQLNNATIDLPEAPRWRAEVRTLRAICWFDAIDNFGNVPFSDETVPVGSKAPQRITREDLFYYIEKELLDVINGNDIYDVAKGEYGRANKGLAIMILAKLYLNAEVYINKPMYQQCVDILKRLDGKYFLHPKYNELFLADNDKCIDEIIFAIEQDGVNTQSYGVTNYLIFASTGGKMDTEQVGISSGWGGLRTTKTFYDKFSNSDKRKLFWTDGQKEEIDDISTFTDGIAFFKFRNVNSDGSAAKANGFVDTDFPLFRYADALLMKAECELRGATGAEGLAAFNEVRQRAGLEKTNSYTLDEVLDERGREFFQEGWRRNDLIRFGKFTSNYLWDWKGGIKEGRDVDEHLNLFPIPTSDLNCNDNLVQNPGY